MSATILEPIKNSVLCRCCRTLTECRVLTAEYTWKDKKEIYSEMIMDCFGILLCRIDDNEQDCGVCTACVLRLRDALAFRHQVLQCEQMFLSGKHDCTEFEETKPHPLHVNIKTEPADNIECNEIETTANEMQPVDYTIGKRTPQAPVIEVVHIKGEPPDINITPAFNLPNDKRSCSDSSDSDEPLQKNVKKEEKKRTVKKNSNNTISDKPENQKPTPPDLEELFRSKTLIQSIRVPAAPHWEKEKSAHVTNIATIFENSNAVAFKMKTRAGFPCFYCKSIFKNPQCLRDHQKTHPKDLLRKIVAKCRLNRLLIYADITDLKCTICDANITSLKDLKTHLIEAHNKSFNDNFLDKIIPFKLENKEINFECQICRSFFETFGALEKHMSVHYKNYICDECQAGFITKTRYLVHKNLIHKQQTTLSCEECKKQFNSKIKFKVHIENVHKKLKKMKCSECEATFFDYFSRQRHLEAAHGYNKIVYKCTLCPKEFKRKSRLTIHINRSHLLKRDIQCDMCSFMCYSKTELKDHMYKHCIEKSFVCAICSKKFARKKALKVHMHKHTGKASS